MARSQGKDLSEEAILILAGTEEGRGPLGASGATGRVFRQREQERAGGACVREQPGVQDSPVKPCWPQGLRRAVGTPEGFKEGALPLTLRGALGTSSSPGVKTPSFHCRFDPWSGKKINEKKLKMHRRYSMREETAGERGGRVGSGVRKVPCVSLPAAPLCGPFIAPISVCALRLRFPFLLEVC